MAGTPDPASTSVFEEALQEFKSTLKPKELSLFQQTTLVSLREEIELDQERHDELRHTSRIRGFLEAMERFEELISIFCNSSQFVPFVYVWLLTKQLRHYEPLCKAEKLTYGQGPLKFLLGTARTHLDSFSKLLDVYKQIGEYWPILQIQTVMFDDDRGMRTALGLVYRDVLRIHVQAMKRFKGKVWKKMFQATFKTFETEFSHLMEDLKCHKELVEKRASLVDIQHARRARRDAEVAFREQRQLDEARRLEIVRLQLDGPQAYTMLKHLCKSRQKTPYAGHWLLRHQKFQQWRSSDPSAPTSLWLTGIPGSGKSILASLVIEALQSDTPNSLSVCPTPVVYFFCKYNDKRHNRLKHIAKSFLLQLISVNQDLIAVLFEQFRSGNLKEFEDCEELLEVAIMSVDGLRIVIDGLDECETNEEEKILEWFKNLVSKVSPSVHILFVKQDDAVGKRHLADIPKIKIGSQNDNDILNYCLTESRELQIRLALTDDEVQEIAKTVTGHADGMFIFARVVMQHLRKQKSRYNLEQHLDPQLFPKDLSEAYERITSKILEDKDARDLLGWLICAKRPLKWYEIQGVVCFDPDEGKVTIEKRWMLDSKDICGSLVEIRVGDDELEEAATVELVHQTAKTYLVNKNLLKPALEELRMTKMCLQFFHLDALRVSAESYERQQWLSCGYYSLLDYSAANWVLHLEALMQHFAQDSNCVTSMDKTDLKEVLSVFADFCVKATADETPITGFSARESKCWQQLEGCRGYYGIIRACKATKTQLRALDCQGEQNQLLTIPDVVRCIREEQEKYDECQHRSCWVGYGKPERSLISLTELYGTKWFKCPRLGCHFFSEGFLSEESRKLHVQLHDLPFRCSIPTCPGVGFALRVHLERHESWVHGINKPKDDKFPARTPAKPREKRLRDQPETPGRTFKCGICGATFTRRHNQYAHERSHGKVKMYECQHCGNRFSRFSDCQRHEQMHNSTVEHKCEGSFENDRGQREEWGCHKTFSRADALMAHYKSQKGQACLSRLREHESGMRIRMVNESGDSPPDPSQNTLRSESSTQQQTTFLLPSRETSYNISSGSQISNEPPSFYYDPSNYVDGGLHSFNDSDYSEHYLDNESTVLAGFADLPDWDQDYGFSDQITRHNNVTHDRPWEF